MKPELIILTFDQAIRKINEMKKAMEMAATAMESERSARWYDEYAQSLQIAADAMQAVKEMEEMEEMEEMACLDDDELLDMI